MIIHGGEGLERESINRISVVDGGPSTHGICPGDTIVNGKSSVNKVISSFYILLFIT
jgi:hypothetical protein